MKCPFGYSKSRSSTSAKPSFLHSAFDGPFATDGNACTKAVRAVRARRFDRLRSRRAGDPAPLERREHGPADLPHLLPAPLTLPGNTDRAGGLAAVVVDDLEDAAGVRAHLLVASLAHGDLLGRLGTAQVLHHRRVAEKHLEQRAVGWAPRHERDLDHAPERRHRHAAVRRS